MSEEEESLAGRLIEKTGRGEIKWQGEYKHLKNTRFSAKIKEVTLGLGAHKGRWYLAICDKNDSACFSSDGGPLKELWELLNSRENESRNGSQIIKKLLALLQ